MPEETMTNEPVVAPTEPAAPTSMFNEDGSFVENWHTLLKDESLHTDTTLPRLKDVENLAKSYVHVRRQVPLNKIAIPTETSTDSEWEEFHKAGGRPETAADYNLAKPEDLPEEYYSPELASAAQELFHKIGLNHNQAAALFKFNNDHVMASLNQQTQDFEAAKTEAKEKLLARWGNAYEQRLHYANKAVELIEDADLKERIKDKFGNDPDFIEYSFGLGSKFMEHRAVEPNLIDTPADLQVQIDEEMAKESYTNKNHPGHNAQVLKVNTLFAKKTG